MSAKSKASIPLELHAALAAIDNSLADSEICKEVEKAGYPRSALLEGRRLYDLAVEAMAGLIVLEENVQNLGATLPAAKAAAHSAFDAFCALSKASFGRNILGALGLAGRKPRAVDLFLAQARDVFDNAAKLPQIQGKLADVGLDQAKLQSERMKIATYDMTLQALQVAHEAHDHAAGERETALQNLRMWLNPYLAAAMTVLRDKKELLEKLGIGVCDSTATSGKPTAFIAMKPANCASATVAPSTTTTTSALRLRLGVAL